MPSSLSKSRLAAFRRQGGHCFYCGAPIWLDKPEEFANRYGISKRLAGHLQCTGEHLTAKRDGGGCSRENIVAACWFCNSRRHRRKTPPSPGAYLQVVQRRMQHGRWHHLVIHKLLRSSRYLGGSSAPRRHKT